MKRPPAKEVPAAGRDLAARVVSSVVLIAIAVAGAWWGGFPTAVVVAALVAIVHLEWTAVTEGHGRAAAAFTAAIAAAMLVFGAGSASWALAIAAAAVLAAVVVGPRPWRAIGAGYAAVLGLSLLYLRASEDGLAAIGFLFAIVWATDIGAFFAGRTLGGPRLWPAISPRKTWAGAIGGLLAGAAAGLAAATIAGAPVHPALVLVAVLVSVAGQFGDLFESHVKRRFGVKDSGAIIPGHGGMMDRVDALVFGAAVAVSVGFVHSGGSDPARGLIWW